MRITPHSVLLAIGAALALTGCGDKPAGDAATKSAAVAKVAAPAGKKWSQVVNPTADGGFVMGNPDAPITLVEYGALTCVHCKDFALEANEALHRDFVDTGQVAYEYRVFLLNTVDGLTGAIMSCAGKDRYYPLMENIYANWEPFMGRVSQVQQLPDISQLPDAEKFTTLAQAYGLDTFFAARGVGSQELNQCLSDPAKVIAVQDRSNAGGKQFDINSTPTFILNGSKIDVPPGTGNWTAVRAALRAAGAR